MNGGPEYLGCHKEAIQSNQRRRSSHADAKCVAVIGSGHTRPAGQTVLTKRPASEVPRNSKQQCHASKIERSAQENTTGNPSQHGLEWNCRSIATEKTGNGVTKSKNHEVARESPGRP